jgi:hypothetical protein
MRSSTHAASVSTVKETTVSETETALDTRTTVGDSVATTEGNSWEEAKTPLADRTDVEWRYSYKYKITRADGTKPMLDYVFASSFEDARVKAYDRLEIPEGEDIKVSRISETTNKTWSLS